MKKLLLSITTIILTVCFCFSFTACNKNDENTIVIGASPTPHAEILEFVKPILAEQGYTLDIKLFDDYVLPNLGVEDGSLDANYFQHSPYLISFNEDKNTDIVSAGKIHYEPFGLFGNNITSTENIPSGTTIFVPADDSNCTRALFLLAQERIIDLPEGATIEAGVSILDVTIDTNGTTAKGYKIVGLEAAQLPTQLNNNSGSLACINGNYAIATGLNLSQALALENADGAAAQTYGNIIAVKNGNENSAKIKALVDVLLSKEVANFIETEFEGAVVSLYKES